MSKTIFQHDGIKYIPDFLSSRESIALFNQLKDTLEWQEETILMYGKPVKVPRLVCWYGDNNIEYRYSGIKHTGLAWTSELLSLKNKIEQHTRQRFNSVLGNLYRDERDSMGWHADDEKELGDLPCIASMSLGEERLFKIRNKKSRETFGETLVNGSLLIMAGNFQKQWQHSIPKEKTIRGPRINLTYRFIYNR